MDRSKAVEQAARALLETSDEPRFGGPTKPKAWFYNDLDRARDALRSALSLPPEAAAPGAKPLWRKCDSCDGRGGFDLDDVCPTCAWAKYLCGVDQTDCRDPWHKTRPVPPPREGG